MKPMLAGKFNPETQRFPVLASPKLDGVRGVIVDGKLLSRSLKPIPNKHVASILSKPEYEGLDGELICGSPTDKNAYTQTTSRVMSHDKVFAFTFFVFDIHDHDGPFAARYHALRSRVPLDSDSYITRLEHRIIDSANDLIDFEQEMLTAGYEGIIVRCPKSPYKFGRSTEKEGGMLKVKRFEDGEATIIGFEELMHNGNEATTNELGRTKRSSHQAGKSGRGTLGALIVRDVKTGVEFNIGTGMDDEFRAKVWNRPNDYLGKLAKYKHFPVGQVDKPRHPVLLGMRAFEDMS